MHKEFVCNYNNIELNELQQLYVTLPVASPPLLSLFGSTSLLELTTDDLHPSCSRKIITWNYNMVEQRGYTFGYSIKTFMRVARDL